VLTSGKDITEYVAFYLEAAKKLAKYLRGHNAYLERDGAYIIAVDAVVRHLGGTPKSIVLEGYMLGDAARPPFRLILVGRCSVVDADCGGGDDMAEVSDIGEAPLGAWVPHYFQFKIDGKKNIKAIVDVDGVKLFELPSAAKPTKRRVGTKRSP
jgi:hypothetical protein